MMSDLQITLPSKPRIVDEKKFTGIYEIDGLYPGYGHTLGNSLRRIILSSLPGASITRIKIDGVSHEFSTISGVKEDAINIILNLRKIRMKLLTEETQTVTITKKGAQIVTAGDIETPGQVEILNGDLHLFEITDKSKEVSIEMTVEHGLGFLAKELVQKDRVEVGEITLDANFTPIRRVNYEVENMRVGERTDFNRLRVFIETDGTILPKEALERSIQIMIAQLKSIVGFKQDVEVSESNEKEDTTDEVDEKEVEDFLKTRVENLELSTRTINALENANIRTVGGLARKKEEDLSDIEGLGNKGVEEIKELLEANNIVLK
jgi:DNA-directed RNA polymerase subunit alpha